MTAEPHKPRILCVGAMLWDVIGHAARSVAPGEDLENESHGEHAHAGNEPAGEHRAGPSHGADVLRQGEDAGAEGGADDEGDQRPHGHGRAALGSCHGCRVYWRRFVLEVAVALHGSSGQGCLG